MDVAILGGRKPHLHQPLSPATHSFAYLFAVGYNLSVEPGRSVAVNLLVEAAGGKRPHFEPLAALAEIVGLATLDNVLGDLPLVRVDPLDVAGPAQGLQAADMLPDPPHQPLNAVLLPAEGNRWMISVADRGITGRIDSWDAFLAALDRLTTTTLRDALQHAQPPAAIRNYRFPASVWKHFERLPRLPRGLIPIGDAIGRFNPIYGQGMSAAVQQSRLLQTALAGAAYQSDPLSAAQAAFMSGIESILQTPWNMALNSDLAFPQTQATRPDHFERSQGAQAALFRTIVDDPIMHRAFVEVSHLLQPYSLLRTPAIRERIEAAAAAK
jgi:hypothetical protein